MIAALAFLTRLPVGGRVFGPKEVARSARWFPLVGTLLGGIYAAIAWAADLVFPALVVAVLVVAVDAWITGALHLDGLADTADGFGGGRTREDVLRIMRDHAVGSYGAVALVLAMALKIATLSALVESHRAFPALLIAPALGRWSAVILGATQPYARDEGLGAAARFIGRTEVVIATLTAVAIATWDLRRGAVACLLVAGASAWWGWRCRRRIGGITGDTLGAGIEISECLTLLVFAGLRP